MYKQSEIEHYILDHIDPEPAYLAALYRQTHLNFLWPRMASGHLQGAMLSMFCKMINPKTILEIGAFTGYSTLVLAKSLQKGGTLHSIEINDELEDFLRNQFSQNDLNDVLTLHIGAAIEIIPTLDISFDLIFIDGNKREYPEYYKLCKSKLNNGGYMIADNTLWDGKVLTDANDEQTAGIKIFNDLVKADSEVEKVIIPFRDGLSIIRRKQSWE